MNFYPAILNNRIMWVALLAWVIAQTAKLILNFMVERKFDYNLLMSSGGFPSSHTAIVSALAIEVGKLQGWDSPLFAFSVVLAVIVMYDAAGVRRAAGMHAKILNYLVDRLSQNHLIDRLSNGQEHQERLKELIGHTPFEVFGGAILGCVLGLLL
ncbi:MAG: divergent PAP2 family protein [Eubacteriales bacterium]